MSLWDSIKASRNRRRLVLAGLWVFIATVLITFRQVLLIFAIAALIAFVLQPAVRRMSRWNLGGRHLPRWGCVIVLYAMFFGAVYLLSLSVVPQVVRESRRLTTEVAAFLTPDRVQQTVQAAQDFVEEHGLPLDFGPADET